MSRMLFRLAIATTVGSLLFSTPTEAQVLPPLKKATRVAIIEGPELESAHDVSATGAAGADRQLVANQLATVVGEDRRPFDKARPLLLVPLAESHLRRRLFAGMLRKIAALPLPAG